MALIKILFRFDIKDPPRYGRLERLRGHEKWASTKRFYSRQLEKGKVRYVHTRGGSSSSHPSSDSFSFIVSVPASPSTDTHNNAMAVQEDSFKIDIISNVIRVRSTWVTAAAANKMLKKDKSFSKPCICRSHTGLVWWARKSAFAEVDLDSYVVPSSFIFPQQ